MLLVFEGVKMGAGISLNGHFIANVSDQFLRVKFPVRSLLQENNTLDVVFDQSIATHGRFMVRVA